MVTPSPIARFSYGATFTSPKNAPIISILSNIKPTFTYLYISPPVLAGTGLAPYLASTATGRAIESTFA